MKACSVETPCKINLHLAIGTRRPDGYHDLESLFAALALSDLLEIERAGPRGSCDLSLEWDGAPGPAIPPDQNLARKAVDLFRARTGFDAGLRVRLVKRVPAGAGLGGGSSDAAAVLRALDALAETGLGADLAGMAAVLGSDVPFFLRGGAAWVTGRGETLAPLDETVLPASPPLTVLLVKPPFASSTARAFGLLDAARRGLLQTAPEAAGGFNGGVKRDDLPRLLAGPPELWPFYNDFLPVLPESDGYLRIIGDLRDSGAAFAGLSGSGSCCFGVYAGRDQAETAKSIAFSPKNFLKITFFLARNAEVVVQ